MEKLLQNDTRRLAGVLNDDEKNRGLRYTLGVELTRRQEDIRTPFESLRASFLVPRKALMHEWPPLFARACVALPGSA